MNLCVEHRLQEQLVNTGCGQQSFSFSFLSLCLSLYPLSPLSQKELCQPYASLSFVVPFAM